MEVHLPEDLHFTELQTTLSPRKLLFCPAHRSVYPQLQKWASIKDKINEPYQASDNVPAYSIRPEGPRNGTADVV